METVALKMDRRHVQLLKDQARARGCSQAAVVRELIERHLGGGSQLSLHERSKDLCGSLKGPPDLSVRKLTGYGRD